MRYSILILALLLALSACGSKAAAPIESETPTENTEITQDAAPEEPEATEAPAPEATEPPVPEETEAPAQEATEEPATEQDSPSDTVANPWRSVTEEEARALCPASFTVPEGAEHGAWSVIEDGEEPLVRLTFDAYDMTFTANEQYTGDEAVDVSAVDQEWSHEMEWPLQNWGDGQISCRSFRHIDGDGYVDLCLWHDAQAGVSYSLTVSAPDLYGFDLQAVAEMMAPAK